MSDRVYQGHIAISGHGSYNLPRGGTNLIVSLLNHPNLRWAVIDLKKKKHFGLDYYKQVLDQCLDKVNIISYDS